MATLSPTVRHRRLVQELRRLRQDAGLAQTEVAKAMDWSSSKQLKIENGTNPIKVPDVRGMLDLYGVTGPDRHEEREILLQLARDARKQGWWHPYGGVIPKWFEVFVGLETEASAIRTYQPELVHGLLQTPEYHRALRQESLITISDEEIERMIEVRKTRQERLHGSDTPDYWTIMNEAVLRRVVGTPEVMRAQLEHLHDMAELPSVTIQVLPFAAGTHPAMDGPFEILGFPESADLDVVYLESKATSLYLEETDQVGLYSKVFNVLRARALAPRESSAMIAQAAREIS